MGVKGSVLHGPVAESEFAQLLASTADEEQLVRRPSPRRPRKEAKRFFASAVPALCILEWPWGRMAFGMAGSELLRLFLHAGHETNSPVLAVPIEFMPRDDPPGAIATDVPGQQHPEFRSARCNHIQREDELAKGEVLDRRLDQCGFGHFEETLAFLCRRPISDTVVFCFFRPLMPGSRQESVTICPAWSAQFEGNAPRTGCSLGGRRICSGHCIEAVMRVSTK
jgi:hypothetical protein